jgi:hypothetical protein
VRPPSAAAPGSVSVVSVGSLSIAIAAESLPCDSSRKPVDVEKEIDKLYAAPTEEFVSRRKALAQKLRKEGERAAAMRVEDLRKPTAAAAVVNKLARSERMNVRALLAAGERVFDAQAGLLRGGKPEDVRKAAEDERKAISALLAAARRDGIDEPILRRVESTLHAAAIDPEGRAALTEGRLTKELTAAGFGLEGMPVPKRKAKAKKAPPKVDREAQKRQRELDRARAQLEAARQRSSDAAAAVKRAEEQLRELERSKK